MDEKEAVDEVLEDWAEGLSNSDEYNEFLEEQEKLFQSVLDDIIKEARDEFYSSDEFREAEDDFIDQAREEFLDSTEFKEAVDELLNED